MYNDDFVFSDFQYAQLKKGYDSSLFNNTAFTFAQLNGLILSLENNSYSLPLSVKNNIRNTLLQTKQILSIIHPESPEQKINLPNNPFALINQLSLIASSLNSHSFKSAYLTLSLKASSLVLKSINEICHHFENKQLKFYKFI